MTEIKIEFDWMSGRHCVNKAKKMLWESLDGIKGLSVDTGHAGISLDETSVRRKDIEAALITTGDKIKTTG